MANTARLDELKKKFDENPRRYFAPLANEYRKQGDLAQAIALCRTHLPNQPGHISGHIVLAQALYESRELAEARQAFELSLDLDPENLIALRYLGDIAREQGAPASAQAWYQRVLEVDPRNEEIAQLLREVEVEAAQAVADLATRPTPPVNTVIPEQPEVRESALESLAGRDFSQPAAPVVEEAPQFEIEPAGTPESLDPFADFGSQPEQEPQTIGDDWFAQAAQESVAPAADPALPDLTAAHSIPVSPESSEDPFESFSMDWAESESPAVATPEGSVEPPVDDLPILSAAEPELADEPTEPALDFEPEVVAFSEPETVAIELPDDVAPQPPAWDEPAERSTTPVWNQLVESVEPDLAPVMDFMSEPVAEESLEVVAEAEAEAPVAEVAPWTDEPTVDAEPVDVVAESSEIEVLQVDDLVEEVLVEADATTDLPEPELVASDPLIGRTPAFGNPVAEEPPAPFVTETMAELYLQQGFNEEALAIYRQLLQQNPGDDTLRQRVAALEEGSTSTVVTPLAPPVITPAGPSVRSFFARFAQRHPGAGGNGDEPAAPTINGAARADEGLTRADDPAVTLPDVFGSTEVEPADAQAATALATAFGISAEQAPAELSLDSLFRDVPARADAAVTGSDAEAAAPAAIGGESGEPEADIEQFTAWLEGLKKK